MEQPRIIEQPRILDFTLHNNRNQSILASELSSWIVRNGGFKIFSGCLFLGIRESAVPA